jgi:hypothetical protein
MVDLLRALFGNLLPQPVDAYIEQQVVHAIELIDPRLKSFSNYPRAYRPAITTATAYAKKLAGALPKSLEVSPSHFAQDPLLHTLFISTESIYSTVRDSQEIKLYCQENSNPKGGELYALMGMRRKEKTVFGREMSGDVIQQDVQQKLVYFEEHTLTLPTMDQGDFMAKLEQHFFDSLIKSLSEQIARNVMQRHELETERDIMASRLRSADISGEDLEEKLQAIRRQLKRLDKEYSLSNYSVLVNKFMDERQQYLRLEQREMAIDMRGVMRESTGRLAGRFVFHDLIGRDRRRWSLYPVRLPVAEFYDAMHCSGDRKRWIKI